MNPERINPDSLPVPGGQYSMMSISPPASRLVVISGQTGRRADGTLAADPIDECRQAFEHVANACVSVGATPKAVVILRTFLVGAEMLEPFVAARRDVFEAWYGDSMPPSSTLLFVAGLADGEARCEIEATIAIGK